MKVWVVIEEHRAEGSWPLAVLDYEPTKDEMAQIWVERSHYNRLPGEREKWCHVTEDSFEVEGRG